MWAAMLSILPLVWWKASAIEDWVKLLNYTAPAPVASIASQVTMTDYAKHLFYVNHPKLDSNTQNFRQDCPEDEQTIVLGCYMAGESGIAIYDVQDPRLAGVQQVTAAHEMLHAAYDRLSRADKKNINNLLQNYYDNDLHDQRLIDIINLYKKTEPNGLLNEMHSIFGTEVTSLPPSLESYYKKYFVNRSAVVALANQYQSVFTQNRQQLADINQKISDLKSQLSDEQSIIASQETSLKSESDRLQALKNSGDINTYNEGVDPFNNRVAAYKALVAKYNAQVAEINDLVTSYNNLAHTQNSLYKALDTRVSTQPAQ